MDENKNIAELHKPVLLNEIAEAFGDKENAHLNRELKIIDATLGIGGHTEALVKNGFRVLGVDADLETLKLASERLDLVFRGRKTELSACLTPKSVNTWGSYKLIHGNFRIIDEIARREGFDEAEGILFDLGVSSPQLTSADRGFSFRNEDAHLDMRLDRENQSVRGSDLLNLLRKDQLNDLFRETLNYKDAVDLSDKIVEQRGIKKIETIGDFVFLIKKVIKAKSKLNVATLPFLALRIAVNSEVENMKEAFPKAFGLLKKGGKLAVISFHSGEDKYVKKYFSELSSSGLCEIVTNKPIIPGPLEIHDNVRSRSAKMRIIRKL